jgi:aminoglycoside phosphotransferase family enzyme
MTDRTCPGAGPGVGLSSAPGFDAVLGFLRTPAAHAAFAGDGVQVETVETHMSWVFLVGEHALKLKKPVRYAFLDFTTLAAREFFCREEVRLNLRLAPGVYRGVMALQWQGGEFALVPEGGPRAVGQTVDWLVHMRRLPAARMLDRAIADRVVGPAEIDALIAVLVTFYRGARATDAEPAAYWGRIQREHAATRDVLLRPQFRFHEAATVLDRFDRAFALCRSALQDRAACGRIVDGHGDLRPEHVCLLQPPVVIDCLEFDPSLRQVDPFDEIAFLGLECEMAGAPWIAPQLLAGCTAALGNAPPAALMGLYTAHRALLRARFAAAHLLDVTPRTPHKWLPLARRYLAHAQVALDALESGEGFSAATSHDIA